MRISGLRLIGSLLIFVFVISENKKKEKNMKEMKNV